MAAQADSSVIETVVQLLCENGLSHMADAMRLMLNEAMRIERSEVLDAGPYQRTEKRRGYANGFKPQNCEYAFGRAGFASSRKCAERLTSILRLWSEECEASSTRN
jgi:putative transposase